MERVSCMSNTGVQCWPASLDFQTPPSAAPANSAPPGASASEVIRPETQRSPAPELLKLLVGSMKAGGSEKSLPSAPGRFVRSIQVPGVLGRDAAWTAPDRNAFTSTTPFGASLWEVNQSAASAAAWLSSPGLECEPPLAARPGATPKMTTAAEANRKATRRMSTPLENGTP